MRPPRRRADLPAEPPPEGQRYQGNHLEVVQTITHDKTNVGTIFLRAGMDDLHAQLLRYVAIVAVVLPCRWRPQWAFRCVCSGSSPARS